MRTRIAALAAAATLLTLAACGTTEEPQASSDDGATAVDGLTVTDSRGTEVKLAGPAKKVVALEWGEAEMLASLDVMPAGVADVKGYSTWVTAEKLDSSVKDLGTRAEPSEDSILGLKPDLVVMEEGSSVAGLSKRLEDKGLPVLVTQGADAKGGDLDRMRSDLTMIAKATGTEDKAAELLEEFDATLAEVKKDLADAGAAGGSFVFADGYKEGNVISIRPFGEGSLVSQVAKEVGLKNVWGGEVDDVWGLGSTDVEGLTTIKDKQVKFLYNGTEGTDVFADGLQNNPIWTSLPFVKAGNVHKFTDGVWTFGGPKSCAQWAEQLVEAFSS